MLKITLQVLDSSGHRTVTFDAATEKGGQELEKEVADLISKGHTVLVTIDGNQQPVIAYNSAAGEWILREEKKPFKAKNRSKATVIKPIVGG
jgi:hypothetical protein